MTDLGWSCAHLVDHVVEPGVVSTAVTEADEWPALRAMAKQVPLGTPIDITRS